MRTARMVKRTTMWAIQGMWDGEYARAFLYVGTFFTRREAIRDFCENRRSDWPTQRKLGNRAVKVTMTWEVAP